MSYSFRKPSFVSLDHFSEAAKRIFFSAVADYHIYNSIDAASYNPYDAGSVEHLFYAKCWVDAVQWHVEDEIRNPQIDPGDALLMKRRIDALNQERTNKVEQIDDYFLCRFSSVDVAGDARVNTESPAWALDRLSILVLKIYHMNAEVIRTDASKEHIKKCNAKLTVLLDQQKDLLCSINELLADISSGSKYMKVYRQMKMYNDQSLNPVLYNSLQKNAS
jgi:hypothetical protein